MFCEMSPRMSIINQDHPKCWNDSISILVVYASSIITCLISVQNLQQQLSEIERIRQAFSM